MVQLAVAVGLISKSGRDHCTGIRVFEADEHCPLEDAQLEFVTQLKRQLQCQTCYLLYRGSAISSFSGQMTLKDCCPASTNCIRFTANYCMDEGSKLTVRTLDHQRWSFRVNLSAVTILDLKLLVEASKGVPPCAQHLTHHNDSRASDVMTDDRPLSWHGVCKDDVLHLTDPPVSTPCNYILDVTSTLARSSIGASIAGPEWRICRRGLNVEGRCVNRICRAFQRLVIHPHVHSSNPFHHMGASPTYMGLVHPSSIQPHCPICRKDFTAEKYGFTDCIWAYDSRQHGRNWQMEDVCSKWQYVPEDQYQRFQLNTREWHNLTFIVRPPPSSPPADRQTMAAACPICHEWLGADVSIACGCSFHASCLAVWKSYQPKLGCPSCKGSVGNIQIKTQLAAEGKTSGSNTMISSHNTLDTKSVAPMQQEETRSAPADAATSQTRAAGCSDTQVATVRALSRWAMLFHSALASFVARATMTGKTVLGGITKACLVSYGACKATYHVLAHKGAH